MTARKILTGPVVLWNESCCYCGRGFGPSVPATKEHLIGRRFVPKGKLDGCWNVIVRACPDCNNLKAGLEDDISAISMLRGAVPHSPADEEVLSAEATRKTARSYSRLTGRPVGESSITNTFQGSLGPGCTVSMTMVGPPHVEDSRAWELARLQVSGFFYYCTYDSKQKRGGSLTGAFCPLPLSLRSDWANSFSVAFMETVATWTPVLVGVTADGFFRVALRRSPDLGLRSWALEWNQNIRMTGFVGDPLRAQAIANSFPEHPRGIIHRNAREVWTWREEKPLRAEDDILFREAVECE